MLIKNKIYFIISVLAFRLALDASYFYFVSPIYTKSFLSLSLNFETGNYVVSWFLTLIISLSLSSKLNKVSDYFSILFVLTIVCPILSIYGLNSDKSIKPVALTFLSYFVMLFVVKFKYVKSIKMPMFKNSRNLIVGFSVGAVTYLILWSIISGAAFNINFDPTKVYDFREENSSMLDKGFLAYINLWVYKFFNIFIIIYFLSKNKYFLAIVFFVFQVFFYAVTAHKMVLFLPILAAGVWFYFSRTRELLILPILYLFVVLISLALFFLTSSELVPSMLIRRAFYVPAGLTYEWISFFDANPKVYWTDSVFSFLGSYPYNSTIPKVVGEHLLGPELAANNGLVSSGYAHAGIFGVILYSLILGYFLKLLDSVSKDGVPLWMSVALTVGPLRTAIADSDLLTAIISHGLVVSLVILILYRSKSGNY
ncbi:hypothetical protein [Rheinheimera fenheensis]|uniref:hypothetical protein n=1 Tax=Rheinheimera fenheensis TaxID=3152295 RepID=UPI00325DF156